MFDFDVREVGEGSERGRTDSARGRVDERAGVAGIVLDVVRLDARVTDIPRGPALMLPPDATVAAAVEAMRRRRRGAVVIVQNHHPVGVVTDRDILGHEHATLDDLRTFPVSSVIAPCPEPLMETDTVAAALRAMCARRQWHMPIVCARGLMLGALDIADVSLWLRDRLTILSVDACFAEGPLG